MAVTVAQAKAATQEHFKSNHTNQSSRLFSNFNKFLDAFELGDEDDILTFYKSFITEEDKYVNLDTYAKRTNWKQHGSVRSALSSVALALDIPLLSAGLGDSRNDVVKTIHQIQKRLLNESKKALGEVSAPPPTPLMVTNDEPDVDESTRDAGDDGDSNEDTSSVSSQCTYQLLVDRLQEYEQENQSLKEENAALKKSLRYFTSRTFALQACFRQSASLFEQNDEHMLGVISQFLNS